MTGFTFAEPPRIGGCPYCGTGRPQVAIGQDFGCLGGRLDHRRWAVFIITCCGGLLLAQGAEAHPDNAQAPIKALYPTARRGAAEIPETARRFLQEAMETLHAPNAAAVMAGRAGDAMLKHLGLTEGSVYSRINQAVSDHILTPAMGKWAHKVRLGANRPRHADTEDPFVSVPEAQQSVDFAEALVLPSRIERGIEAATKEAKASGGAA